MACFGGKGSLGVVGIWVNVGYTVEPTRSACIDEWTTKRDVLDEATVEGLWVGG